MIILDTNQLEYIQPPDGPLVAMLQKLATQTGHRLWLPEIVLEEHLAHYRNEVQEAERARRRAEARLKILVPYLTLETQPAVQLLQAVQDRTHRLQRVFLIRRTPDGAARESLLREARRQPPAKASWETPGTGARDAAIWLTAITACKEEMEHTYFVAQDSAAFGKGALKPELVTDLELHGIEQHFRYCSGVDALLGELAAKHDPAPGHAAISRAMPVREAVREAMDDPRLLFEIISAAGLTIGIAAWLAVEQLTVTGKAGPVVAYKIGDTIWACASLSWRAGRTVSVAPATLAAGAGHQVVVTFKVRTTLVMQLAADGTIQSAEVTGRGQAYDIQGRIQPG